jgi:membrane protease YdiL (CAAX protease family)
MQPEDLDRTEGPLIEPDSVPLWEPLPSFTKPPEERDPFWGYADLLLLIGLLFMSVMVVGVAASAWVHFHPSLRNDLTALALPMQFVVYALVYVCFFLLFKYRYDRPVFQSLHWCKTGTNLLMAGLGGVLLAFGIGIVASSLNTPKVDTPFDQLVKTPWSFALLAITAVVFAPLFEEMVFRGFLQPLFSRTFGVAAGIGLTALLFGGLHAPEYQFAWQYVAAITVVGIALGILRAKTNSIIPGTVMHGCFNSVSVVGLLATKYITHK